MRGFNERSTNPTWMLPIAVQVHENEASLGMRLSLPGLDTLAIVRALQTSVDMHAEKWTAA